MKSTVNRSLTPKQKSLLDFISEFRKTHGYSPSLEEMKTWMRVNAVSTVHQHVESLQRKGYIKKGANLPRDVSPMERSSNKVEVPLMGRIAAGTPIEPFENPEPVQVPDFLIKSGGNYYALEIKGDSMIEEGIWDKDIVLIRQKNIPEIGEIVVAVSNGEVTLKKFGGVFEDQVKLIPRNPRLSSYFVPAEGFEIRGVFAGLVRKSIKPEN